MGVEDDEDEDDDGRESKRHELHDESNVSVCFSPAPLPLLSPLLEYVGPVNELPAVLEYTPLLLYDSLALLESPSSLMFNRPDLPNLPS